MNGVKRSLLTLGLGAVVALAMPMTAVHADDAKPAAPAAPAASGATAEVKVGTGVEKHEITGEAATFPVDTTVWVWSRVHDGEPSVKHVWKKDGKEIWSATLDIGSKLWSTQTRRVLKAGNYSVDVTTADGATIGTVSFTVQ
jgi:hypothetical protein